MEDFCKNCNELDVISNKDLVSESKFARIKRFSFNSAMTILSKWNFIVGAYSFINLVKMHEKWYKCSIEDGLLAWTFFIQPITMEIVDYLNN